MENTAYCVSYIGSLALSQTEFPHPSETVLENYKRPHRHPHCFYHGITAQAASTGQGRAPEERKVLNPTQLPISAKVTGDGAPSFTNQWS